VIDLQQQVWTAELLMKISKPTAEVLREDATRYVETDQFGLAMRSVELAEFWEAVDRAGETLREALDAMSSKK